MMQDIGRVQCRQPLNAAVCLVAKLKEDEDDMQRKEIELVSVMSLARLRV
jgi:hypothetical protein